MNKGWRKEKERHVLAAHGIGSSPVYFCSNGIKTIEHTAEFKQRAFKRVPLSPYSNLSMLLGVPTSIQTMNGTGYYIGTEIENNQGEWDQDYYISQGEWVIHDGKYHHVYINNKVLAGFEAEGVREDLNTISKKMDKHASAVAKEMSTHLKLTKVETKELLKKIDVKIKAGAKKTAAIISDAAKETKKIKDDATRKLDNHAAETAGDINKIFKKLKTKEK
jgi:hypothetical protein